MPRIETAANWQKGVVIWMRKGRERNRARFLSGLLCIAALWGAQAEARAMETPRMLVPVGHTIGIKLFSDGVVVVGLSEVEAASGVETPGADCGLRVGDVIEEANGTDVESSEQFAGILQCGGPVELLVCRSGMDLALTAQPALGPDGVYRLGAWIRDSMAGIGTVTFYDPATGKFGALGHGITDNDTGLLMPLHRGAVMDAAVKAVKKGNAGEPGELKGSFDLTRDMGELSANTEVGVFGVMEPCDFLTGEEAVPVAKWSEVREGAAVIRANVSGDAVEEYDIEITKVLSESGIQNMLVKVTDPRLIRTTGGIVQGMSGSPIIQDGKLVGAVTHVLVNDPTTGYGIFIENMLDAAA